MIVASPRGTQTSVLWHSPRDSDDPGGLTWRWDDGLCLRHVFHKLRDNLRSFEMLVLTTPTIESRPIQEYHGLVSGEAILGANVFKDFFASIRDIVGGRSAAYEGELRKAKEIAIAEMCDQAKQLGANAVVGVDLDFETIGIGSGGNMLMVSASGTAVVV